MSPKQNLEDKNASQVWLKTCGEAMRQLYLGLTARARSH